VNLVNSHAGQTCIHLRFADDSGDIDFVANAARFSNGSFEFQAGFETYGGNVEELAEIRAEVIQH
jgi:hypothetical protein